MTQPPRISCATVLFNLRSHSCDTVRMHRSGLHYFDPSDDAFLLATPIADEPIQGPEEIPGVAFTFPESDGSLPKLDKSKTITKEAKKVKSKSPQDTCKKTELVLQRQQG